MNCKTCGEPLTPKEIREGKDECTNCEQERIDQESDELIESMIMAGR